MKGPVLAHLLTFIVVLASTILGNAADVGTGDW
jgi:hypothetical protein